MLFKKRPYHQWTSYTNKGIYTNFILNYKLHNYCLGPLLIRKFSCGYSIAKFMCVCNFFKNRKLLRYALKKKIFQSYFQLIVQKITLNPWMILLENHEIYKMIINANWVQYENSLKIYKLGNISLPKGSFASTYFNFRVTKYFIMWEQIWVAFCFL